ncbi:MAG: aldo/keto reductase [Propionibacteriaceae bacterium]|jgi:aryl-alcohol dehydrogenase-like predicted oxidoreductase|nr:aldo/keto reductase [Propionibacteriaceae bacterium]
MNDTMEYRDVPYVDKRVSRIVFGTAIGSMMNNEDRFDLLDAVFEAGITTYDSAASYGEAEASLGRWVKARGLRDQVTILTKGANPSQYRDRVTPFDIMSDIEDSFAKLQTDFIDIYILHRDSPRVPVGPIVECLNKLHIDGRIGAFGGSNWTLARTLEVNAYAKEHGLIPFTVCSPNYCLADMMGDPWGGSVTISGDANADFRDWLRANQMPIFAYSSLGRGFLSGKIKSNEADRAEEIFGRASVEYAYPINFERLRRAEELAKEKNVTVSQVAYSWLMHQDLNVFGITGTESPDNIRKTVDALHLELSAEEMDYLHTSMVG